MPAMLSTVSRGAYMPVRNFKRGYYDAGTQNWCVEQDSLGRVYFGNTLGLLAYDGSRWGLHVLPNSTTIRTLSLDPATGYLYAGATNEFGYFAPDSITGQLHYKSLATLLPEADRDFTEIWNIMRVNRRVWFQGDYALYRYDGKSVVAFPIEERISRTAYINGILYVALQSGKVLRFNGSRTEPLPGTDVMTGKKITALLPYTDRRSVLIATANDGLYIYDGATVRPLPTRADNILKSSQIFCATSRGSVYVFGTVDNGAVSIDLASDEIQYINRHNGMQNNTVLSAAFDKAGNLWLMLDNGIDYAIYNSPISALLSHLDEIGAGYASKLYGDRLYLGTNQGLYSRPAEAENYSAAALRKEINGQIWGLENIDGTLFVFADAGIFYLSGGVFRKIDGLEGGYKGVPLRGREGEALVSTYSKFHKIVKSGSEWVDAGAVAGYDDIGGSFFQSRDGAIWKDHWKKGVFRLTLTPDARKFSKIELFDSRSGLPTNNNNSAVEIDGKVYISSENGIYRYDAATGKPVPDTKLSICFMTGRSGHLHALPDGKLVKISPREFSVAYTDASGEWTSDSTTFISLSDQLIPGFEHINYISPREVIISCQEGFKSLDMQSRRGVKKEAPTFVSAVYVGDSLIYTPTTRDTTNPHLRFGAEHKNIRIEYTCTDYTSDKGLEYSTLLEGYDEEWTPFGLETGRNFGNLREGKYTFRIRTRHPDTGVMTETSYAFTVLPPWYRTIWAYMIYLIIIILFIIWLIGRVRKWKKNAERNAQLKKENELSEVIRNQERETLLKDHEIAVLKSEKLEHDIKHKSSELGNTTMNLIRKNEILTEISAKIAKLQEDKELKELRPDLHKSLREIRKSISENISHDDDWKAFTENFDIVYQDYTRRLRTLHPELTSSDIRICCYIRMGLSSKEIAPLVNNSFRSVEMTRYRLRKKMNLPRDIILSDYLHTL